MPRALLQRLAAHLLMLAGVVLAGGFIAAALVRYSPGFDSIPEDLDPRISPATLRALHVQHERSNSLPVFYVRYLAGAIHGDLGVSQSRRGTEWSERTTDASLARQDYRLRSAEPCGRAQPQASRKDAP